eukprot:2259140-Amphidinium_carterae.1
MAADIGCERCPSGLAPYSDLVVIEVRQSTLSRVCPKRIFLEPLCLDGGTIPAKSRLLRFRRKGVWDETAFARERNLRYDETACERNL